MTHELAELMLRATTDLINTDSPELVVHRVRAKRRRRLVSVGVALTVGAAAISVPLSNIGGPGDNTATVTPASIPAATPTNASASARSGNPNCHHLKPVSVTGGGKQPTVYTYKDGPSTITQIIPAPASTRPMPPTRSSSATAIRPDPPTPADSPRGSS